MRATRTKKSSLPKGPFWRKDARERLSALLPELMLTVVASTCSLVVMGFLDDMNPLGAVVLYAICVVVVQGALYALTYLSERPELANMVMLLAISFTPMLGSMTASFGLAGASAERLGFGLATSAMLAMMVFYLTRLRATFYFLLLEVLVISEAIQVDSSMVIPHLVGLSAYIALYIVRHSHAHVSMSFDGQRRYVPHEDDAHKTLPLTWQTALLAAVVGALCLTLALGTGWCVNWWHDRASTSSTTSQASETESRDETQTGEVGRGKGPSEGAAVEDLDEVHRENEGTTTQTADTTARSQSPLWPLLVFVFALVLPGLPFAARLLARRLTRLSISREPQPADQAARIYLEVLSRLKATGIERGEGETPREFLILYEDELAAATASAGIRPDDWTTITDVYEKARYAELDATEDEIETCWRIYDALPTCARHSLGWFRYLTGPFWHM